MLRRRFILACGLLPIVGCDRTTPPRASPSHPAQAPKPIAHPWRLAPLSPALALVLRDLGLGESIVARHGFDAFSPQTLPIVGDQTGLDYEALLRLQPTHVLLEWGARPLPPKLQELASVHGWTISNHSMLTLDDIRATTLQLRDHFPTIAPGMPTRDELAARFDLAWAPRSSAGQVSLREAGRVLLLAQIDPPAALGPGSCHHQLLERLGATPALARGAAWITLDAEDVLRLAPEAIVLIVPRAPGTPAPEAPTFEDLTRRLGRLGTLAIPAIQGKRVALIDDPLCQTPSTSMIALADELDRVLRVWAKPGP
jgi:ABC-type Fe3+-hydroxamate transport system substrate-binding protein